MNQVAVLGAGPAGAMAARQLALHGLHVTLIDEKPPWEKPCGGGVTFKAYQQYPFLTKQRHRSVTTSSLHAAHRQADLKLEQPLLVFSRKDLNQAVLNEALQAGATFAQTRVTSVEKADDGWRIHTRHGLQTARHLIIATGARNALRACGTAFQPADTMTALGYFVPIQQQHIDIQFFDNFEGYIWNFPRQDHVSLGICGKGLTAQTMRHTLETYMAERGISTIGATFYAHMLPSLEQQAWQANRLSGAGWTAVGDAAGLVDPVTGEGIYYALRSGELAGNLYAAGNGEAYDQAIQAEFAHDLAYASTLATRLFRGRYLLGGNTTRMVQLVCRSRSLNGIMQQLFAGVMPYTELRTTLKQALPRVLAETGWNTLRGERIS